MKKLYGLEILKHPSDVFGSWIPYDLFDCKTTIHNIFTSIEFKGSKQYLDVVLSTKAEAVINEYPLGINRLASLELIEWDDGRVLVIANKKSDPEGCNFDVWLTFLDKVELLEYLHASLA